MDKHTIIVCQEAKVSVLSKLIFKVNAISIKIPSRDFQKHRQVYLTFIWKGRRPRANSILKREYIQRNQSTQYCLAIFPQ